MKFIVYKYKAGRLRISPHLNVLDVKKFSNVSKKMGAI
jgi:hypothetical protein